MTPFVKITRIKPVADDCHILRDLSNALSCVFPNELTKEGVDPAYPMTISRQEYPQAVLGCLTLSQRPVSGYMIRPVSFRVTGWGFSLFEDTMMLWLEPAGEEDRRLLNQLIRIEAEEAENFRITVSRCLSNRALSPEAEWKLQNILPQYLKAGQKLDFCVMEEFDQEA